MGKSIRVQGVKLNEILDTLDSDLGHISRLFYLFCCQNISASLVLMAYAPDLGPNTLKSNQIHYNYFH